MERAHVTVAVVLALVVVVTAGLIASIRASDCATMARFLSPRGRLVVVTGGPRSACRAILRGMFLAPTLRRTPHPIVRVMGGDRTTAFAGLRAGGTFFTAILSDAGAGGLRVLDVLPSTPVALPVS